MSAATWNMLCDSQKITIVDNLWKMGRSIIDIAVLFEIDVKTVRNYFSGADVIKRDKPDAVLPAASNKPSASILIRQLSNMASRKHRSKADAMDRVRMIFSRVKDHEVSAGELQTLKVLAKLWANCDGKTYGDFDLRIPAENTPLRVSPFSDVRSFTGSTALMCAEC